MPSAHTKSVTELFGLPEAPKTGRDRLVAVAIELFYRHGFGAIGIDRIIQEAGVTKTTFYKHFQSKDDLMVAAVQRRDEWESQAWHRAVKRIAGEDPARQLMGFLEVIDLWFNDPDFGGCMFLNAATEFPNPHDRVHQAASAYRRKSRNHFRDLALSAGAGPENAEAFADCFAVLIEGALVMRQTYGRNDAARAIRPAVQKLLESYLPQSAPKPRRRKAR